MAIQRQVVLECVKPPHHNKFYEITIMDQYNMKEHFYVESRWGRIEHFKDGNPQQQIKDENLDWDEAMATVGTIMYSKLKKGYKVVKDSATNPLKDVAFTAKSTGKKKAVATVEQPAFDRTEHVETIVSDWWTSGLETIEERVV